VLAELARTDSHRFRILVPDSDRTKALRALTRSRQDLVSTRIALANQLRDQLACFWPGASKVFNAVDSKIALAFLRRYPSPADAHGLGEQRLQAFLTKHGYTGRKPASELLQRLRAGAEGRGGELETDARRQVVLALISALEPIVARISELTIEIRHALEQHPDGEIFRSLFISSDAWLCAATMLAEIGDCRERYPNYRALAADAGQCPVAKESGKSRRAQFRWACDHRLREAFNVLADSSRRHNPWANDIYTRARARGAGHAHASRILGRSRSQVIWRLWHDHDTYQPTKHTARQRLLPAGG
jgi:transposase